MPFQTHPHGEERPQGALEPRNAVSKRSLQPVAQPRQIVEPFGADHAQHVVEANGADALQPVERLRRRW